MLRSLGFARALIASIVCVLLTAQSARCEIVDRDSGYWAPISLRAPIYKKWQASVEYQPRFQKAADKHLTESIVRFGAGYEFNKKFSIFGGAYYSSHFKEDLDWENRLWEQATYTSKLGRFTFQNRLRLEQIEKEEFVGSSWRIRHQLRITTPVPKYKNWYLVASEEPFFNLNSAENGPRQGFNQNRMYFGVGRQLSACTRLEVGYLHQYKNNRGNSDLSNNLILNSLTVDLTALKRSSKRSNTKLASVPATQVASSTPSQH
jgi:hypothetical protein